MSFINHKSSKKTTAANRSVVETLEGRTMMSAAPAIAQVAFDGGTELKITGIGNDVINVVQNTTGLVVTTGTGWTETFTQAFSGLLVRGGAGTDKITIDPSVHLNTTLYGGAGNDTLISGSGNDTLYAGAGKNVLEAGSGTDTLISIGGTADTLIGGAGRDNFWAGSTSADVIQGTRPAEVAEGDVHRVTSFLALQQTTTTVKTTVVVKKVKTTKVSSVTTIKETSTAITAASLAAPLIEPATDGYAYKSFANEPLFAAAGPTANDIYQGQVGDCYFLSTLSSVAKVDAFRIEQSVVQLSDGTYLVQFSQANGTKAFVRVDANLPVFSWGSPAYAELGQQNSMWVAIMEKAFTIFRTGAGTYDSISSGWMDEVYADLGATGKSAWGASSATALLAAMQTELLAGKSVTYAVNSPALGANLVGEHAYMVDSVITNAQGVITGLRLRNPWGIDGLVCTDGSNDGYVIVTPSQALASMLGWSYAAV